MLHAVVLAGGAGTRFWPLSRQQRPKQLLALVDQRTMLQTTIGRLDGLVDSDRLWIATTGELADPIRADVPSLRPDALLLEPCKRNTAPCIGLAAARIAREDPDAVMLVTPADHVIQTDEQFHIAVQRAVALVQADPQRLITFGIKPTYPSESFGYIQREHSLLDGDSPAAYPVRRFREKPSADVAAEYITAGDNYWNAGIFVWRAKTIVDLLTEFEPEMAGHLESIVDAIGSPDYDQVLEQEYSAATSISIDYAVMERAGKVIVVEAPFHWDDVGGWQSLARLRGQDDSGNTIVGPQIGVNTTGTIVRTTDDHLIATLGVTDLIIVHTHDATLVANKHDEESIRKLVELLKESGLEGCL